MNNYINKISRLYIKQRNYLSGSLGHSVHSKSMLRTITMPGLTLAFITAASRIHVTLLTRFMSKILEREI